VKGKKDDIKILLQIKTARKSEKIQKMEQALKTANERIFI
jgi:hypothetical protein